MPRCIALFVLTLGLASSAAAQGVPTLHAERDMTVDGRQAGVGDRSTRIRVSASGTMALAPALSKSIVLVDGDKHAIRVFGERGARAGDVNVFQWFGWIGDSLWVGDPSLDRLTVFKPDMSVARTEPMPAQVQGPVGTTVVIHGASAPLVSAVYGDGTLLVNEFKLIPKGEVASGYLLRITRDGAFKGAMGIAASGIGECHYPSAGLPVSGVSLFCASPPAAISPDGLQLVTVSGSSNTGDSTTFSVTVIDEHGRERFTRRYAATPTPVRAGELDSAVAYRLGEMTTFPGGWNETLNRRLDSAFRVSAGKFHPPVLSALVGNDGTIWLERSSAEGGGHWLVLDAKGDPIGDVILPGTLRLRQVSRNTVWGQDLVSNETVNIVRYQISRPPG